MSLNFDGSSRSSKSKRTHLPLPFTNTYWEQLETICITRFTEPEQIIAALMKVFPRYDMTKFFKFLVEKELISEFLNEIFPFLQHLILQGPELFPEAEEGKLKLLKSGESGQIELTRRQCTYLLACAFLGFFYNKGDSFYQPRNWTSLWEVHMSWGVSAKYMSIFTYFKAMLQRDGELDDTVIIVARNCIPEEESKAMLQKGSNDDVPLVDFEIKSTGGIGDEHLCLNADFANEYIGGGVLIGGNVQEEIMFTVRTECLVSLLLCEKMHDNESIILLGTELFSEHTGYGGRFKWKQPHTDETPFAKNRTNMRADCIVALDAIMGGANSFKEMKREILKSYAAFSISNELIGENMPSIHTGNWGCGMFGGHPVRKALCQWVAASLSPEPRSIVYYTFKDRRTGNLEAMTKAMLEKGITVNKVLAGLNALANNGESNISPDAFFNEFFELGLQENISNSSEQN